MIEGDTAEDMYQCLTALHRRPKKRQGSASRCSHHHPPACTPPHPPHPPQAPTNPPTRPSRAFNKDHRTSGAVVAQSAIWAFIRGERGRKREKTHHNSAPREEFDAMRRHRHRDRTTGMGFLPVIDSHRQHPSRSGSGGTGRRSDGMGRHWG
jgi:hypothetical protein